LFNPWLVLSLRAIQIGVEAQTVVALRLMRLAGGGADAQDEAQRMVTEKIAALAEAQTAAVSAFLNGDRDHMVAAKALGAFKKRIRANKRRLSGP
jgi:hypothetical protein